MQANKANRLAAARISASILALLGGLGCQSLAAGFRSPESLVRNVYAHYGDRTSALSSGLPRECAL